MRVVALHGFLGLPSDWDLVFGSGASIEKVDLWKDLKALGAEASFKTWSERFIEQIESGGEKAFLLGYSLGGRLAMRAMTMAPHAFHGAVIVSANPGLIDENEKKARLASDLEWAERFASDKWSDVVDAWNSQKVLQPPPNRAGDFITLIRREESFDRELLSRALDVWSLGRQADLSLTLKTLTQSIRFVTGESDVKFTQIAAGFVASATKNFKHLILSQAGHRVPWDNPTEFRRVF